jgi:uracil-DNA glycosylase family 4
MDKRLLEELELDSVATLYRLADARVPPSTAERAAPGDAGGREAAVRIVAEAPAPRLASEPDAAARVAVAAMDWEALEAAARACTACGLCKQRKQAVFGVGHRAAPWLFVGEGPGADEDAQGEPFVGQAGRLLDSMLTALGLARGREVYIANVVKCRPPGNRTPLPDEAAACAPFLDRQIELIRPRLIVAMGKTAALRFLNTEASLGSLRGRVHRYRDTPLVVTYHPAYLLRNLPDKAKAWEDLLHARRVLREAA